MGSGVASKSHLRSRWKHKSFFSQGKLRHITELPLFPSPPRKTQLPEALLRPFEQLHRRTFYEVKVAAFVWLHAIVHFNAPFPLNEIFPVQEHCFSNIVAGLRNKGDVRRWCCNTLSKTISLMVEKLAPPDHQGDGTWLYQCHLSKLLITMIAGISQSGRKKGTRFVVKSIDNLQVMTIFYSWKANNITR